jgi:hypothetical protein
MYKRAFLNKPRYESVAVILAEVTRDSTQLTISDCSRQISLDFSHYTAGDRENGLYKANLLVEILTQFRDELTKKYERIAKEK